MFYLSFIINSRYQGDFIMRYFSISNNLLQFEKTPSQRRAFQPNICNSIIFLYCRKFINTASATIPTIIRNHTKAITIAAIFTPLRLSLLFTQITESSNPKITQAIFPPAHMLFTLSATVILNRIGI